MIITTHKQTEAERYFLFKQMDSARNRFVTFARQQFGSALNKQFNQIIEAFRDGKELSLTIFARNNPMEQAYLKVYQEVGVSFAKRTLTTLEADRSIKQQSNQVDLWLNFMRDFTLTKAGERITNVSLNSLDIVRKVLNEGVQEGLGVQEIARNMRRKWTELSRFRSELIARTEVIGASNRGSLLGAESTGLDLKKSWLSTRDNRTRDAHFAADGQVVGLHERFNVGGEMLEYPGDPAGSGDSVINCRCTVTYVT